MPKLERLFREDKVNYCLRTLLASFLLACVCGGNAQLQVLFAGKNMRCLSPKAR